MGKYDIGTVHKTNNCGDIEVVGYVDTKSRIIKFIRSGEEKKTDTSSIKRGEIADSTYTKTQSKLGIKLMTDEGYFIEVVDEDDNYISVLFLRDGNIIKVRRNRNLKAVKNPMNPTTCGVGYLGRQYKDIDKEKSYNIWSGMISRCYDINSLKNRSTYKNVTVCNEWLNYTNFKEWFDRTYIEGYHLDKDLMQLGDEFKEYSPLNCVWLPREINSFLTNVQSSNTSGFTGVHWDSKKNKYRVNIKFLGKRTFLGYSSTIEEARKVYQDKRNEACEIHKANMRKLGYWSEDVISRLR